MRVLLLYLTVFIFSTILMTGYVSGFDDGQYIVDSFKISPSNQDISRLDNNVESEISVQFDNDEYNIQSQNLNFDIVAAFYNQFVNTPLRDIARSITPSDFFAVWFTWIFHYVAILNKRT